VGVWLQFAVSVSGPPAWGAVVLAVRVQIGATPPVLVHVTSMVAVLPVPTALLPVTEYVTAPAAGELAPQDAVALAQWVHANVVAAGAQLVVSVIVVPAMGDASLADTVHACVPGGAVVPSPPSDPPPPESPRDASPSGAQKMMGRS
jgi:hypothetical protein